MTLLESYADDEIGEWLRVTVVEHWLIGILPVVALAAVVAHLAGLAEWVPPLLLALVGGWLAVGVVQNIAAYLEGRS